MPVTDLSLWYRHSRQLQHAHFNHFSSFSKLQVLQVQTKTMSCSVHVEGEQIFKAIGRRWIWADAVGQEQAAWESSLLESNVSTKFCGFVLTDTMVEKLKGLESKLVIHQICLVLVLGNNLAVWLQCTSLNEYAIYFRVKLSLCSVELQRKWKERTFATVGPLAPHFDVLFIIIPHLINGFMETK